MKKEEDLNLKEVRKRSQAKHKVKDRHNRQVELITAKGKTNTLKNKNTIKNIKNTSLKNENSKEYSKTSEIKSNIQETKKEDTKVVEVISKPNKFDSFKKSINEKIDNFKKNSEYKKIQNNRQEVSDSHKQERPKGSKAVFIWSCITSTIVGIGLIVGIIALVLMFKMLDGKPQLVLSDLKAPESSTIYDSSGAVISELGEYKRENVGYDDMPNVLVDAFLSIEDSRFFSHNGFDIPRFLKAALANLKSGSFSQGGSTFDMQLIKNTYFQIDDGADSTIAEKKVSRKLQEIFLAIEADYKIDKEDIFASYLNRINFGNNIRGVQKASLYYFGKDVNELDLSESAFLAGLINSPNYCNPYNNLIKFDEDNIYVNSSYDYLANGTQRRNEVLDMMVYHGYISELECEMAKAIKLEDQLVGESNVWNDTIPYYQSYIDAVIEEAKELTGLDPTTNSMKIYTSMDTYMQQLVYDIQNTNNLVNWYRDDMQNAIVSMNNQTGEIVAIGGGRNQSGSLNWNRATMSRIQPGSTIKPVFEYLLAFEDLGWATTHTITDKPIYLYGSDHLIANASGTYDGDMLLTEAVSRSLNTPAIQTLELLIKEKGEDYCIKFLQSIGLEFDPDTFDLQYAIGGNTMQVSPKQLAGMHAILFNGGNYIEPHTIRKVILADGTEFYPDTTKNKVVSEAAAFLSAYLEYEVVYGDFYNYTQILKDSYPVFAKTGTTDWGDSGEAYNIPIGAAKDSWLVCSTSEYTNAIWLGFDRVGQGTYITMRDDNINLKGQIGNILLDEGVKHFEYEPTQIKQPDDVVSITHVKGLFPYIEPTVGTPVTGLIKKGYEKLNPASSIQYEAKMGTLSGIDAYKSSDTTIDVTFNVLSGAGDGMQDLTATSLSGKVTHAYGRLYFPRVRYISPQNATYYAQLYINGIEVASTSSTSPYATINYSGDTSGNAEVCGNYNLSDEKFCIPIDLGGGSNSKIEEDTE